MLLVIIFSLVGGLLSLSGAMLLFGHRKTSHKIEEYATAFAAGVLLAAAFTDLLPEAIEKSTATNILLWALIGILVSFVLERFLHFFHHHHEGDEKKKSSSLLIIIGDTLHNAIDGLAIGAAFLVNPAAGITTALAVSFHEIPQEIGDFGIMIKNGMKKSRVIWINILSSLVTTITAVGVYIFGDADSSLIAYVLALTAGFFIYIAASDLIPQVHHHSKKSLKDPRPYLLLFGAALIMIISPIAHTYIAGHSHDDEHSHEVITDDHDHGEDNDHHEDDDHDY